MSIATAITNLQGKIANAYTAIENKGGTLPATQNAENLSATIEAMSTGGGGGPVWGVQALSDVCQANEYGEPNLWGGVSAISFDGVTDLTTNESLRYAFYKKGIKSISFPDLSAIRANRPLDNFARYASNLSAISFPKLETLSGESVMDSAFNNCSNLSTIEFPELTYISSLGGFLYEAFTNTQVKTITFPKLKHAYGRAIFTRMCFSGSNLSSMYFPELTALYLVNNLDSHCPFYQNNSSLKKLYFPKLSVMTTSAPGTESPSNNASYLFYSTNSLLEIHFGAANESILTAAPGYSSKWGAPSGCQIYFDL